MLKKLKFVIPVMAVLLIVCAVFGGRKSGPDIEITELQLGLE